jgi:hypothetical protein
MSTLQDEKPTPDPEGKEQTDQDDNKYKKDEKKLSTWHALSKYNSIFKYFLVE